MDFGVQVVLGCLVFLFRVRRRVQFRVSIGSFSSPFSFPLLLSLSRMFFGLSVFVLFIARPAVFHVNGIFVISHPPIVERGVH